MNVASTHATVVQDAVISADLANVTGPSPGSLRCSERVTTAATLIATISLHALIRHQYQRRIYTAPVPIPRLSTICQPWPTEVSCPATQPLINTSTMVKTLPMPT